MFTRPKFTRTETARAKPIPKVAVEAVHRGLPQPQQPKQPQQPNQQQHAAERELRRLIDTLRPQSRPPAQSARFVAHNYPHSAVHAKEQAQTVAPPPLQPKRQPISTPQAQATATGPSIVFGPHPQQIKTQATKRLTTRIRTHLLLQWLIVGGLAVLSFAADIRSLVAEGSSAATKMQLQAMAPQLAKVEATQAQHDAHMQAMAALLQATAQEIKHPPSNYTDAELAFKHQRYLEAESGFNRYAQEKAQCRFEWNLTPHNRCTNTP